MVLAVPNPGTFVPGITDSAAFLNQNIRDAVTFLRDPPLCRMHQNTVQSVPNATNTAITFDVNDIDSYAGHSTVTNNSAYFAQVAGWYRFGGFLAIAAVSTTATTWAFFTKTGTQITPFNFAPSPLGGNNRVWFVGTDRIFLGVGDYIQMFVNQNDGAARNTVIGANMYSSMFVEWSHS